jgi:indole-3-glycerol phosphate synthase
MSIQTGTFLDRIVARTLSDLPARKSATPIAELERRAAVLPTPLSFDAALRSASPGIIAEIKRASPSKGPIAEGIDAATVARDYLDGGASAISVLTDEPFFGGCLADLEVVSAIADAHMTHRPVLRKDFLVDRYQVVEARVAGADAVLLIVSLLAGALLRDMLNDVHALEMQALVEVHDEAELDRAVESGARVIGINNRDLKTFTVDLATTERLAPLAPAGCTIVAESGIHSRQDVRRLTAGGAHALLIGESLMLATDRRAAMERLRG